jgi:hypothetical protein
MVRGRRLVLSASSERQSFDTRCGHAPATLAGTIAGTRSTTVAGEGDGRRAARTEAARTPRVDERWSGLRGPQETVGSTAEREPGDSEVVGMVDDRRRLRAAVVGLAET